MTQMYLAGVKPELTTGALTVALFALMLAAIAVTWIGVFTSIFPMAIIGGFAVAFTGIATAFNIGIAAAHKN